MVGVPWIFPLACNLYVLCCHSVLLPALALWKDWHVHTITILDKCKSTITLSRELSNLTSCLVSFGDHLRWKCIEQRFFFRNIILGHGARSASYDYFQCQSLFRSVFSSDIKISSSISATLDLIDWVVPL